MNLYFNKLIARVGRHLARYDVAYIVVLCVLVRVPSLFSVGYADFPEFYRDYHMARGIASGEHFPVFGPPSMLGGFSFGPVYYYLLAPLLWVSNFHPAGLLLTGMALYAAGVWMMYRVSLAWTGSVPYARVAAVCMAIAVYGVHLTSYTSNPNFLPVFVLWYLYHLTTILTTKARSIEYIAAGIAFAVATQLHVTALLVLPVVTLGAWIVLRSKVSGKGVVQGGIAAACVYAPYLIADALQGFANVRRLFALGSNTLQGGYMLDGVDALVGFFYGTLTPFYYPYGYTILNPNWMYVFVAVACSVPLVALLFFLWARKTGVVNQAVQWSRVGTLLVLGWFVVQAVVIALYSKAAHDHYLIILWPVPIFVLASAVVWLEQKFRLMHAAVFCIICIYALQLYSFYGMRGVPWSSFFITYEQKYKYDPNVSTIGSKW